MSALVPTPLPPGWVEASLGEIGRYLNGRGFKKSEWSDRGRPIIRIQDLTGTGSNPNYFDGEVEPRHEVEPGDFLISWAATLGAFIWRGPSAVLNQHIFKVESSIDRSFHFYLVQRAIGDLYAETHGSGMVHITKSKFERTRIPVPPLGEQRQIVEAIETQFTRLDAAEETLKRVQVNLKRYRASILQAAVEGRLVPTEAELARQEGRDYEPAYVLLERILQERRRRWEQAELAKVRAKGKEPKGEGRKAKYKEPKKPEASDLHELPEGWCWATVELVGVVASGQTPKGIAEKLANTGDVPWFRVGDMNSEGNERLLRFARTWLAKADAASLKLSIRPSGTIVFPKRGGAIATNKKRRLAFPSAYDLNTMGVVPDKRVAEYLWLWFSGLDLGTLADGSNVPQINHGDVEPLVMPLPPESEQERIVGAAEKLLSLIETTEQQLEVNRHRCQRLRQSILRWAFEGNLVDQSPSDEPASELIRRIRTNGGRAGLLERETPGLRRQGSKTTPPGSKDASLSSETTISRKGRNEPG